MDGFKFTEAEKEWMVKNIYGGDRGMFAKDMPQIEGAASTATYYYYEGEEEQYIGRDQARRMLGTEEWLSGLTRAAFHWNAAREAIGGQTIFIDCRAMFTTAA